MHDVLAVQKAGRVNYTTCTLQTSEDATMKAICFSPDKVNPLRKAMENKSPVKVRRFEYNEKFNNIVINRSTAVMDHNEPLPFPPAESSTSCLVNIATVKTTSVNQLVLVKATVKHLSGPKIVKWENGSVQKRSCVLQDPTGAIKAVLWEEWIDSVEDDQTYLFTNLRVKKDGYTNEIYVNTAKSGFEVKECVPFDEVLPDVGPAIADLVAKQAIVSIIGVKTLNKYNSCNACGKKVEGTGKTVKCESCKVRQRVSQENANWYARLFVQNVETKEKVYLTVFHSQLMKILAVNEKEITAEDNDETVTDMLLDSNNITITYNLGEGKIVDVLTEL